MVGTPPASGWGMSTLRLSLLTLFVLAPACGGLEPTSAPSEATPEPAPGEEEQVLEFTDDAACLRPTSLPADAVVAMGSGDVSHTTQTAYDGSCGYILEVTNTLGKAKKWSVNVESDVLDLASFCTGTEVSALVYGLKNGAWEFLDSDARTGGFVPTSPNGQGGVCFTVLGDDFPAEYSKIRIRGNGSVPGIPAGTRWRAQLHFTVRKS